jgi:DNA-binding transcriptional LysR family regulator
MTADDRAVQRQPTLRQLRGFQAVARHRSFSRAAQALALTQPALSAAIRDLERLLDVALFERSTHHVALTDAGAALLSQVEWLLNSFAHGVDDMHRTLAGHAQRLRLAALPSTMHLFAPALAAWQRQHPDVALAVRDLLNDDLLAALRTGEIDIGLGAELDRPAGIAAVSVGSDDLVALLPDGHALAARDALRWRDLRGQRLALFARGSTYELALSTLRQHGVDIERSDRLLYSESIYSLARSGLALGVISRLYTHGVALRGLRVVPLHAPSIVRGIALMVRERPGPRSTAARDCFGYLVEALRRAFPASSSA